MAIASASMDGVALSATHVNISLFVCNILNSTLDNTPINVTVPDKDPGVIIGTSAETLAFTLTINRIAELNQSGTEVYTIPLGGQNFTSSLVSYDNAALVSSSFVTRDDDVTSANKLWKLEIPLENHANLTLLVSLHIFVSVYMFFMTLPKYSNF